MTSDKLWGCDIVTLVEWILKDEEKGYIFGIHKDLFFVPEIKDPFRMRRYGQLLETPLGVAAGPHTQLSQNLITAWLTGARYFELKTVQVLDELNVTKPCIDMADEGYNCEWSQELKLNQSFNEYLNAWIVLHILRDKLMLNPSNEEEAGFIFNMSVGYNMEGILSSPVQNFLDRMIDCSKEKKEKIERLAVSYPRVKDLNIPDSISNNITISTMHGCPPDEVEKIGRYFIEERKFHTTIKLNPTLLGADRVRVILNDKLGFKTEVPDLAFEHDLKYSDGVALIRSLLESAERNGVEFGIKLTNTLETINKDQNLPKTEQIVYMSGRSLHPISINLAARLQEEFQGTLDISFCAGVDYTNVANVLACNLKPVTVCSDFLKPGGYARLSQYFEKLREAFNSTGADTINKFILNQAGDKDRHDSSGAGLINLKRYAAAIIVNPAYQKKSLFFQTIKTDRKLDIFDCIKAPCMTACAVEQNIPDYMYYTARGDYAKALEVIHNTNPFPNIQGMVCDHICETKCTRLNYDAPLLIREIKRFVAQQVKEVPKPRPANSNGIKVAIIGAGPSGLSCAYFLSLFGFSVEIFEQRHMAGGWASSAIPAFRLDDQSIQKDIDYILSLGVMIHYGAVIDRTKFDRLQKSFDYIYIAVGAQEAVKLDISGEDAIGVMDQLSFLSAVRGGEKPELGKKVVVIGGGNSAIDAARTAKRLIGHDGGDVCVLYRRTREEMPASFEEIQAMLDEGVSLTELTSVERIVSRDGRVSSSLCCKNKLVEKDGSGRPKPVKIEGSEFEMEVDTLISAVGQRVILNFFPEDIIKIDPVTNETQISNVFAGGDAIRGASTLIKAIADGKGVAESIYHKSTQGELGDYRLSKNLLKKSFDLAEARRKRACRQPGVILPEIDISDRSGFDTVVQTLDEVSARREAARCLQCDEICSVCVSVCPNRANIEFDMKPVEYRVQKALKNGDSIDIVDMGTERIGQRYQILNIGDYCNECGNCVTFCPTSGAPYRDKAKFHLSAESFDSAVWGYHFKASDKLEFKDHDRHALLIILAEEYIYEDQEVKTTLNKDYSVCHMEFKNSKLQSFSLKDVVCMAILSNAVRKIAPFNVLV